MGLIIDATIQLGSTPRVGISPFYLLLPKEKLSLPYQTYRLLNPTVLGTLLDIRVIGRSMGPNELAVVKAVTGKDVKFFLATQFVGSYDFLYFEDDSWALLRDSGFVTGEYVIRVKLTSIKPVNEPEIKIYPLRDVS